MGNDLENLVPEVSVVIPTYNRVDMVLRAVESVLKQSFENFECIVVDDGSSDGTFEKLSIIDDSRLKLITQENKGVSAARNTAVKNSRGNYIALLDSDDEWEPRKFEKQLLFMKEGRFEITQTDEIWIRKGKRVNQCKKHEKPEGFFFDRSLAMCMVSPSCVIFSRKFWDDVGPFDEEMAACEDYDLWLRSYEYPVGLLQERLTIKHGGRPDQLSNSVGCLDLFRMYSIAKLIMTGNLDGDKMDLAVAELERKAGYFSGGCRKRGKDEQALKIEELVRKILDGEQVKPSEFIGN